MDRPRLLVLVANPCDADARVIRAAEAAAADGFEVLVLATQAPGLAPAESRGGVAYRRVHFAVRDRSWMHRLARLLPERSLPFRAVRGVAYLARRHRWYGEAVAAEARAFRPDVVHAHDLVTWHAALDLQRATGAKVVIDAHELETDRNPPPPWPFQHVFNRQVDRAMARADLMLTVGEAIARRFRQRGHALPVEVVFNAPRIQPAPSRLRATLGLDAAVPLIVYTGKVTVGRGLDLVLRALPAVPAAHFAMVGPADDLVLARLRAAAAAAGLAERVHWVPPVPFDQVVDFVADADLGLVSVEPQTLSYTLSMPNKLFEMGMSGVPILANRLPEVARVIEEYALGESVDFKDVAALASAIRRGLSSGPTPAAHIERFRRECGWDGQAARLVALLRGVLRGATTIV